ncbi:MAG: sulfurtransferase TusA family protein [Myxococcales bacterium]|nr:sulfurtransferase TusA family protein [Myxococcota bacterium]MDW8282935.1 sulfurtransferase TusA family protein [Myxococcales bacterium]
MVRQAEPRVRTLDLSGEVCPYTFLRSKLALEEMDPGDELIILLDHRPAFDSVPRALRLEGHEVLGVDRSGDRCTVHARKGGP